MIFEFSLKIIVIRIASVKQEVDIDAVTLCGRVMAYVDIDLGLHWLRQWFVAWWHQAITWTNVD